MKNKGHESWYATNATYSAFLDAQDASSFRKYVQSVTDYLPSNGTALDVGCGTGIALNELKRNGIRSKNLYGVDVSKTSIKKCKAKKLKCSLYDGAKLPFPKSSFDVVASINVLEHTDNPIGFLNEKVRVAKKGGYVIVVCPNFLSITNSYHHHTRELVQKVKNLSTILLKSITKKPSFAQMQTIERDVFLPDDDAVNVTNPIDIMKWASLKNLQLVYWSSQQRDSTFASMLDRGVLRLVLGSCFFVYRKK